MPYIEMRIFLRPDLDKDEIEGMAEALKDYIYDNESNNNIVDVTYEIKLAGQQ